MNTVNLNHMSVPNTTTVSEVLGSDYAVASANDDLQPSEVIEANHALADYVYGSDIAQLLRARHIDALYRLHADTLAHVASPTDRLHLINPAAIGIVVLRPESVELTTEYEALVTAQGLAVVMHKETSINFGQYWGMYHHGLIHPDSYMDFPTRTLNYVDKPLHLMVVTDHQGAVRGQTISDYLHSFKGEQGCYRPDTLRGGVAFTALSACLDPGDTLRFRSAHDAMALDPIGAYRQLARNAVRSDGLHNFADLPLLFYAGQAVHIPDDQEVLRDLSILCSEEEVDSIADALQTNNV